ncbi:MAG TPA: ACT domain-containing protein [Coriobacteriia bacterium]
MRTNVVFTLTGPDRIGIVEEVTRVLFELGGNVETSRMARLGGEFAILMLVAMPEERRSGLEAAFAPLVAQGYKVTVGQTEASRAAEHIGWLPYQVEVTGADHEGIVHEVAAGLSRLGINIESAETCTTAAPVSGTPLFTMTAQVVVPPGVAATDWVAALSAAADESNVDIEVTAL